MKVVINVLLMLFMLSLPSQSLYSSRANTKVSYTNTEDFSISFENTMYGITFKQNDRMLTNTLKTKIKQFMKTTNRKKFQGLGKFTLNIIQRQGKYYVVDQKRPERLLLL